MLTERTATAADTDWVFACPHCRTALESVDPDTLHCSRDGRMFYRIDGIWRFLTGERAEAFTQFIQEYETIRQAEGRGSSDPAYYQSLPFKDLSGVLVNQWRIRATSYQAMERQVLRQLELAQGHPLAVLDLGAGNGWLSHRLALHGHRLAAVDLSVNALDGLGAYVHYDVSFTPVQAEFDRLPLTDNQADLVVFNGSLHYATSYEKTLGETLRVLRADGLLVIMDSPIYHDPDSGRQMVQEREATFAKTYGFPSNALPSEGFLTYARLDELADRLGINWQLVEPFYGWRWALKPWQARLRGHREPAKFLVIVGRVPG